VLCHDSFLIWILGVCASVLQLRDVYGVQQHVYHSDGGDEHVRLHDVLSCGERDVYAHGDAHVQRDEYAFRALGVS